MRYIILLLSVLALGACSSGHSHTGKNKAPQEPLRMEFNPEGQEDFGFNHYNDGDCEYIVFYGVERFGLTHKGDCKNPIHCYNEISE